MAGLPCVSRVTASPVRCAVVVQVRCPRSGLKYSHPLLKPQCAVRSVPPVSLSFVVSSAAGRPLQLYARVSGTWTHFVSSK